MKLSKLYVVASLFFAAATSCVNDATYLDEDNLLTDSIITTDEDGRVLNRVIYLHDQQGRDSLTISDLQGVTSKRFTAFSPQGDIERETTTRCGDTIETTYATVPDGLKIATTTAVDAQGRKFLETTVTEQDIANRSSCSTTTSDGRQRKSLTFIDEAGNVTQVTTWLRDNEECPWDQTSRLSYEYDGEKLIRGSYAIWADTSWVELSSETYTYDETGRLTQKDEHADEICVTTTYTYDSAGNMACEEIKRYDGAEREGATVRLISWEYGKVVKTEKRYETATDIQGRPTLTQTVTTTFYSPKPTGEQKGSQRD